MNRVPPGRRGSAVLPALACLVALAGCGAAGSVGTVGTAPAPPGASSAVPSGSSWAVTSPSAGPPSATTPPPGPPSATPQPLGPPSGPSGGAALACARSALAGMTPQERAGQVMMIGISAGAGSGTAPGTWASAARAVTAYRPAGVFLRGRSTMSRERLTRSLRTLQATATTGGRPGLHVAVDQEGGQVQGLRGPGFPPLPSAREQGRWEPEVLARRTRTWATALAGAGVTLDLAPVADTVTLADPHDNPPIGATARNYGTTPEAVGADVAVVVAALEGSGVGATLKHFPGLGRVLVNTDFSDAASDPATGPDDPVLGPFRDGVEAGATAVMMSSARYPGLDADHPAVFSERIIGELLRERLGFTGIVVSDDLGQAVAVRSVPVGERATRFLEAGGDLVLTVRTAEVAAMRAAIVSRAASTPRFRDRVDDAATRVLETKVRAGLLTCAGGPAEGAR